MERIQRLKIIWPIVSMAGLLYGAAAGAGELQPTSSALSAQSDVRDTSQQRFGPPIVGVLRFDNLIYHTTQRHSVDYALVMAVIHAESFFNPDATSVKGAAGLMQLMPATAHRYGIDDRYNPSQNVDAGVRYLRDLLQRYAGDIRKALAAYNAGEDAVDRYRGIPPFEETRDYVRKVLRYAEFYRAWP